MPEKNLETLDEIVEALKTGAPSRKKKKKSRRSKIKDWLFKRKKRVNQIIQEL
jgi:hypothetical protein